MRYCNTHGIPHSRFLEEWDPDDRAKCIAFEAHHAMVCSRCGTAPWEWDPEQGGSRFAYEPVEEICFGCEMKDWVQKDQAKNDHPGKYVALRPRNDA